MFDPQRPRIIHAPDYRVLGEDWGVHLFLVEQPDGSWRKATGADLVAIHGRFPGFLTSLRSVAE